MRATRICMCAYECVVTPTPLPPTHAQTPSPRKSVVIAPITLDQMAGAEPRHQAAAAEHVLPRVHRRVVVALAARRDAKGRCVFQV